MEMMKWSFGYLGFSQVSSGMRDSLRSAEQTIVEEVNQIWSTSSPYKKKMKKEPYSLS